MSGLPGLFDVDERLKRLSDLGDQLLAFSGAVDFEIFRADLDRVLGYSDGAQGGRPPFDAVLMFKILVIQAANNLSDERAEFPRQMRRICANPDIQTPFGVGPARSDGNVDESSGLVIDKSNHCSKTPKCMAAACPTRIVCVIRSGYRSIASLTASSNEEPTK